MNIRTYAQEPDDLRATAKRSAIQDKLVWNECELNFESNYNEFVRESKNPLWLEDEFYGKYEGPVMVIASGPSLARNIDFVMQKHLEGTPIICVDKAYRYMNRYEGFDPLLLVSVDFQPKVLDMYDGVCNQNIALSLCCDWLMAEMLSHRDNKIYWFGAMQPFSPFWGLKVRQYGDKMCCVRPGGIVTASAVDIAYWMGFNAIMLIGCDLCFDPLTDGEAIFEYAKHGKVFQPIPDGRLTIYDFTVGAATMDAIAKEHSSDCAFVDASNSILKNWDKLQFVVKEA